MAALSPLLHAIHVRPIDSLHVGRKIDSEADRVGKRVLCHLSDGHLKRNSVVVGSIDALGYVATVL
jgi:hypothetical protein